MNQNEKTARLICKHFKAHPKIEIPDLFKFLYQSAFGCEHMCGNTDNVLAFLKQEISNAPPTKCPDIAELDGEYFRLSTEYINKGLSPKTLAKLFILSAKTEKDGLSLLKQKLEVAKALILSGDLPLNYNEFLNKLALWEEQGFPPLHHSPEFRAQYNPSYRVISKKFLPLIPLLLKIDTALCQGSLTLAIEGGSASGKTTLSETLEQIYDCTVFHMDDFFLRPEQRTKERLLIPGGNIDKERFLEEVLSPLKNGKSITYRPFNCSTMSLEPPITVKPKSLCVIEGAYSMHPDLRHFYDLSVFLETESSVQKKRILKRNTPSLAQRFFEQWIPLEETYFNAFDIKNCCDMAICLTKD